MPKWSEDEINLLKEKYYSTENDLKEIIENFPNREYSSIKPKLKKLIEKNEIDLLPKNKINYRKSGKLKRLLEDDLETFYWIGFLLADGTFNDVELGLELKGKDHLEKFINYLNSYYDIQIKKRNQKDYRRNNFALTVRDQETIPLLKIKFDIKLQKTYNPPDFSLYHKFSDDQVFSLLCGFIDGDGCIRKIGNNSLQITLENHYSWRDFHYFYENFLFNYFNFKKNRETYVRTNSRGYSLITLSQRELILLINRKVQILGLPVMEKKWSIIQEVDQCTIPV